MAQTAEIRASIKALQSYHESFAEFSRFQHYIYNNCMCSEDRDKTVAARQFMNMLAADTSQRIIDRIAQLDGELRIATNAKRRERRRAKSAKPVHLVQRDLFGTAGTLH